MQGSQGGCLRSAAAGAAIYVQSHHANSLPQSFSALSAGLVLSTLLGLKLERGGTGNARDETCPGSAADPGDSLLLLK